MTSPGPGARLTVSADLSIAVTAPDGSATRIRVSDAAGELLVDVDQPLTVLRALPPRSQRRALMAQARSLTSAVGASADTWPPVRVRTRGYTVATAKPGQLRPGPVVAGAAGAALGTAVAVLVALFVVVLRLLAGTRRT